MMSSLRFLDVDDDDDDDDDDNALSVLTRCSNSNNNTNSVAGAIWHLASISNKPFRCIIIIMRGSNCCRLRVITCRPCNMWKMPWVYQNNDGDDDDDDDDCGDYYYPLTLTL